jgi:S-(hydroxymethyl)glutathione dehydrogenase/alcohol dehydrogenase
MLAPSPDVRVAKAAEYGLTHQINASRENAGKRVKEILGDWADVTIDGTGNPKVVETAYDLAKLRGGRCVLFGVMPHDQRVSSHTLPLHFGRVLAGSEGGQSQPDGDILDILRQIAGGDFDPSGFINRRGSLTEVNEVMSEMRSASTVHAVLSL